MFNHYSSFLLHTIYRPHIYGKFLFSKACLIYYLFLQQGVCCSNSCWHIKYTVELKETLVPHHIKTAGCHGHEPNRLCLLSSTYKCQIRPLESGLRLLTWQIRGGFGGVTFPIASHPYIRGPELSLLCGVLTSLLTLSCVKANFDIPALKACFVCDLRCQKHVLRGLKKVHACFSAHAVVFPTRCTALPLSVLT